MSITVRLYSGLANQLFQWAAGRLLANHLQVPLHVDIDPEFIYSPPPPQGLKNHIKHIFDLKSQTDIDIYNQQNIKGGLRRYELKHFSLPIDKVGRFPPTAKDNIYAEPANHYFDNDFFKLKDGAYLTGYFQSYKYLDYLKDDILSYLKPTHGLSFKNKIIKHKMQQENSVFIHVRRGDYTQFGVCLPLSYYSQAILIVKKNIANPHFFIFSDDPDWAKKEFASLDEKIEVVATNDAVNAWQDLILMSYAKHGIIANSSFSWWAGYLLSLRQKQPCLVAPNCQTNKIVSDKEYLPPSWHIIDCKIDSKN